MILHYAYYCSPCSFSIPLNLFFFNTLELVLFQFHSMPREEPMLMLHVQIGALFSSFFFLVIGYCVCSFSENGLDCESMELREKYNRLDVRSK